MEKKKWYLAKTVWVGFIALVGGVLQATGVLTVPISPETQIMLLGFIGVILRLITKDPVEW